MKAAENIKHICFDLDGTLVDSYDTIYKSTLKAMGFLNINESLPGGEFQKKIGHHFLNIFSELKIPVPDIDYFINVYRNFYFDFIDESKLYPKVITTLETLCKNGFSVSLLTTKVQDQAKKIVDHFKLGKYFSFIMGRRDGTEIKPSAEPLLLICRNLNLSPAETIMVGDSEIDIRCGKNAKTFTCAAGYGYRSKEILSAENPDYMISGIDEIIQILL